MYIHVKCRKWTTVQNGDETFTHTCTQNEEVHSMMITKYTTKHTVKVGSDNGDGGGNLILLAARIHGILHGLKKKH